MFKFDWNGHWSDISNGYRIDYLFSIQLVTKEDIKDYFSLMMIIEPFAFTSPVFKKWRKNDI